MGEQTTNSVEREFRLILANMEVWLSYGLTASLEPATTSGEREYGRPPGDEHPPHLYWREEWERASEREREKLLAEAAAELEALTTRKLTIEVTESQPELEARMIKEGRGWGVREVALHFNCTPTFVRRVRLTAGVNAESGDPPSDPVLVEQEGERARKLAGEGLSERQIRMILKCGGSKLTRLLGDAAA